MSTHTVSLGRGHKIEVHGHRGCRGLRPECTLPAFSHAVTLGVDVLELDVVMSADQQLVVSHEPWMNAAICLTQHGQRIPPAEQNHHNLYQLPYSLIRQYDCGRLRHPSFPSQQVMPAYKPLLSEVVAQVDVLTQKLGHDPIRFSVEVKSTPSSDAIWHPAPTAFVEFVLAQLLQLGIASRTTILSFDKRVLRECRHQLPALSLCLLVEDTIAFEQHIDELGFVPAVYGPHHQLVTADLIDRANSLAMQLVPWTVNEPDAMRRLIELEVAGITTDYPDRLLHLLSETEGI